MIEYAPAPVEPGPILVIDDEPYILRSLSYLLTREGYCVEAACNGEEGLQRARESRPVLIFLDIMLPHMDGYAVCEQIRQEPALAGTYVILLSAKGQQIDRERGMLVGADEYMTKPFSPREVAQRVRAVLADLSELVEPSGVVSAGTQRVGGP